MKRYLPLLLRSLLLVLSMPCLASAQATAPAPVPPAQAWMEDFKGYAAGSDAAPAWDALDVGFSIGEANGRKVLAADVAGERGMMIWRAVPFAAALHFEATMRPLAPRGRAADWKLGGVGLYVDDAHYWHLALVEEPQGGRHYVELSEMFDSVWNAHYAPGTRLTVQQQAPDFEWRYGVTYRLRMVLGREDDRSVLRGEVWEGDQLRWQAMRVLHSEDNKDRVVKVGRPILVMSNLSGQFDEASTADVVPAPEPPARKLLLPAYANSASFAPATGVPPKGRAGGFFRVEQIGNRWWLFDPLGQPSLSIGTDHVNYRGMPSEKLGYAPYNRILTGKYADETAWATEATRRLSAWHFNVLGWGSSESTRRRGLAHTESLNFGTDFSPLAALVEKTTWTGFPDVFDPRWVRFCELRARQKCAPLRDDPWLMGYFLDNELEWWGKTWNGPAWGMALETAKQPAASHGKRALLASLRRAYRDDLATFNADFTTALKNWDDFLALPALPAPGTPRAQAALTAWVNEAAQRYFEVTTAAVRRHDPHHLILGSRFAFDAPDAAWQWAGKTCDIVSFNIYPRVDFAARKALGLDEHLRAHFALCGKPMMVTEWSFPALDAKDSTGQRIPSKHGAGMRVDTQAQKAQAYLIMQEALLRTPFVVGSHYFMWVDQPASGISSTFPEDSNYGLVSETDTPYAELTRAAGEVNAQALRIHAGHPFSFTTPPDAVLATRDVEAMLRHDGVVTLQRDGTQFSIENGALRLASDGGALKVMARDGTGWTELGRYFPLLQQVMDGQARWVSSDHIESMAVLENTPKRLMAEVTFAQVQVQPWHARVRFTIGAGQPWIEAQVLEVKNSGDATWEWKGYYHYTPSRIGGDAGDDTVGIPDVPNYWLKAGAWRDEKSAWHFGVLSPRDDERLHINFWKSADGAQHPDCFRAVAGKLAPGTHWAADQNEPAVVIFGLRETPEQPRPWSMLAQLLGTR